MTKKLIIYKELNDNWVRFFIDDNTKIIKKPIISLNNLLINSIKDKSPYNILSLRNKFFLCKLLKNKDYYPETYHFSQNFLNKFKPNNNLWFVKPYRGSAGKKMFVVDTKKELIELHKNKKIKFNKYFIQKEIIPKLINGYKFDIRNTLVTVYFRNRLEFYLYNNPVIRTSVEKYDFSIKQKDNNSAMTHLIRHSNDSKLRNGQYLKELPEYPILLNNLIRIFKDLVKTLKSKHTPYESKYKLEFRISGPDVIFDQNNKAYLLEINNLPGLIGTGQHIKMAAIYDIKQGLTESIRKYNKINLEKYNFIKL